MALFLVPGSGFGGAGMARADGPGDGRVMSEVEYEEALAFIAGTKAVMAEAEAALGSEVSRPRVAPKARPRTGSAAETQRDDLAQRLDMLRRLMTAAAQRDRIGAKGTGKGNGVTPERERARDVIQRAGEIEDPLQDLWTAWSQRTAKWDEEPCSAGKVRNLRISG